MRQNPLYPSVRTVKKDRLPLAELRLSLEGGKDSEAAAQAVANLWSASLMQQERSAGYQFYYNALTSWLPGKSKNTRRSYAGTLVSFFDFASRRRWSGQGDTLRLVAPHQLNQADVDSFIEHLRRPAFTPETLTNKTERNVFEWIMDRSKGNPARIPVGDLRSGLTSENIMFKDYLPKKAFLAAEWKEFDSLDYVISSLARKGLVNRRYRNLEDQKTEPRNYEVELKSLQPVNRSATQVQRLHALSSFWNHLLTDKKLGMSRRPGALEPVNPWRDPSKSASKADPGDAIRKAARKMSERDLTNALRRLAKRRLDNKGFLGVKNVLAARDELAIFFYVSTGLRREEGMQARVENARVTSSSLDVDPNRRLLLLGGVRRKGRKSDEEVFIPAFTIELRKYLYTLMKRYVDETPDFMQMARERAKDSDNESGIMMEMKRRAHFASAFEKALLHVDKGPIVPAIGRWGNSILKAKEKGMSSGTSGFNEDLVQVPMDGRNLLDRMSLLAGKDSAQRFHPHSLRHLSVMMAEGIGDGSALGQAIAGHRSGATTDIYRDLVSLQAAAVLKVSDKVINIMAKANEEVEGKKPADLPDIPGAIEVQDIEPEPEVRGPEAAPDEPMELEPYEGEAPTEIRHPVSNLAKYLEDKVKIIETVVDTMVPIAAKISEAQRLQDEVPKEVSIILAGDNVVQENESRKIQVKGSASGAKQSGKGKQKKALGKDDVYKAIPASDWFLDATHWHDPEGDWIQPIYLTDEELGQVTSSGKAYGPQVVSRWGYSNDEKKKKVSLVSSMRTYVPYIFYFNKKSTEKTSAKVGFSDVSIGAYDPFLSRNASRRIVSSRGSSEIVKSEDKEPRQIKLVPQRLIYLPLLNMSNVQLLKDTCQAIDQLYWGEKGISVTRPDQSRAMIRWLIVMLHSSKRAQGILGDSVNWVGPSDIISKVNESAYDALVRTRPKVLREPDLDMVSTFLMVEGIKFYGAIGRDFNIQDESGRIDLTESRIQGAIDRVQDFQEDKLGSFLSVYDLPPWIYTDDPIGDPKLGLDAGKIEELKKLLNLIIGMSTPVRFTSEASGFEQFWDLIGPFASDPDAKTIELPRNLEQSAMMFIRRTGVDPLVGCRRFVRHLWEIRSEVYFRGQPNPKKINQIWGLLWSWILPSSEAVSIRLAAAGTNQSKRDVKRVFEHYMAKEMALSMQSMFDDAVESFRAGARSIIEDTSLSGEAAAKAIDEMAYKLAESVAGAMAEAAVKDKGSSEILDDWTREFQRYQEKIIQEAYDEDVEDKDATSLSEFKSDIMSAAKDLTNGVDKASDLVKAGKIKNLSYMFSDHKDAYESFVAAANMLSAYALAKIGKKSASDIMLAMESPSIGEGLILSGGEGGGSSDLAVTGSATPVKPPVDQMAEEYAKYRNTFSKAELRSGEFKAFDAEYAALFTELMGLEDKLQIEKIKEPRFRNIMKKMKKRTRGVPDPKALPEEPKALPAPSEKKEPIRKTDVPDFSEFNERYKKIELSIESEASRIASKFKRREVEAIIASVGDQRERLRELHEIDESGGLNYDQLVEREKVALEVLGALKKVNDTKMSPNKVSRRYVKDKTISAAQILSGIKIKDKTISAAQILSGIKISIPMLLFALYAPLDA